MTDETIVTQLAQWVNEFDYDGIPGIVVERAKFSLLDALGGALAATTYSEAAAAALEVLDDVAGSEQCAVIGRSQRASVVDAVYANCMLIRALDFNDYLEADPNDGAKLGSHPSDTMAVGLSVGEWRKSSGRAMLTAMIMGYELNGRIQKLFDADSNWDHTTAMGLAAPAIAGRLMGLDEDRLSSALGFGMAHGLTPGSVRRGVVSAGKFIADPMVARAGVFGALLAARGVSGPISIFDGSRGVARAAFPGIDLSVLVRPLDKHYMFEGACLKGFPCFANSQAPVTAALEARRQMGDAALEIERVNLTVSDSPAVTQQLAEPARRYPTNQELADHSYHFVVAVALIDGAVNFHSYENERWNDPQVTALMDRIEFHPEKSWSERIPSGSPAGIAVTLKDGKTFTAEVPYPLGHIRNPLDATGLADKFRGCVEGIVDADRTEAIIDTVMTLEKAPSLDRLMGLLAGR
jgi:2-methylcitrate dehydratase